MKERIALGGGLGDITLSRSTVRPWQCRSNTSLSGLHWTATVPTCSACSSAARSASKVFCALSWNL